MNEKIAIPRKGARRRSEITSQVQRQLDAGTIETASLPEGLAVDFAKLMRAAAPEVSLSARRQLNPELGITQRMALAGRILLEEFGPGACEKFAQHTSDTVRGWSAYALAANPKPTMRQRIATSKRLADDPHFGVREWAWIALRPSLAKDIESAIRFLAPWTVSKRTNVRRFAVEITRPRGVWCRHIEELKRRPELGLPLLEPLRADGEKYVQDSVANWLNDASKTRPEWVREVCDEWLAGGSTPATERICKRALRSLDK